MGKKMAKLLLLRRKEWLYRNDYKILDVSTLQARYTRTQNPVSPLHPLFPQQKVEVQRHQYKNCASAPGPVADGKQYKAQGLGSFLGVISTSKSNANCEMAAIGEEVGGNAEDLMERFNQTSPNFLQSI